MDLGILLKMVGEITRMYGSRKSRNKQRIGGRLENGTAALQKAAMLAGKYGSETLITTILKAG